VASAILAIAAPALAQKDDHTPKHGGILVETMTLDFEIVTKPDLIQVYVGDRGKSVKLDGAKGQLTLLNGSERSEIELAPVGDKMEAKGSFRVDKGTKGLASVTLAGKSAAVARFEVK
jgi:hypothetical protein